MTVSSEKVEEQRRRTVSLDLIDIHDAILRGLVRFVKHWNAELTSPSSSPPA